jgi:hypothetical protein
MVPILPTLIEPHDLLPPLLCPRYAPRRLARRNGLLVVNSVLNVLRLNSRWVRNHLRVRKLVMRRLVVLLLTGGWRHAHILLLARRR